MQVISKTTLKQARREKFSKGHSEFVSEADAVTLSSSQLNLKGANNNFFNESLEKQANRADYVSGGVELTGKFESGFDVPIFDNGKKSFKQMIKSGALKLKGDSLMQNWQTIQDAMRLDLTIRKQDQGTVRDFIYDIISNPNYTRTLSPTELNPYGLVFNEVNGTGQSVKQGKNLEGQSSSIQMKIYGAGYSHDLLHELFDPTTDLTRLNDAVAVAYSAIRDDLAIKPIIDFDYSTATNGSAQTSASGEGDNRQEELYNTIWDGLDDLAERIDPITKRRVGIDGVICLASSYDARHISEVVSGLPNDRNRNYRGLPPISQVIAYDGETIDLANESFVYGGVPQGKCYLIRPNRYMKIPVKRGLTAEFDPNPDVKNLSRGERSWWFVESLFNDGIQYFIQEVDLPTWKTAP